VDLFVEGVAVAQTPQTSLGELLREKLNG
jgi:hypothetical protein